jgi:hypothetical protein
MLYRGFDLPDSAALHPGYQKSVRLWMVTKLRYKYTVESITELTGEPFSCPGMQDYLNPL